jgi:hypothetical protein
MPVVGNDMQTEGALTHRLGGKDIIEAVTMFRS